MLVIGAFGGSDLKRIFTGLQVYYVSFLRLVVIPVAVMLLLKGLGTAGEVGAASVALAAMPAAANTVIFAEKFGGDAVFASRCVALSTLLSARSPFPCSCCLFLGVLGSQTKRKSRGLRAMYLTPELAQQIAERTTSVLGKNINIMDQNALLLAAGMDRLNTFHEGAVRVLQTKNPFTVTNADAQSLQGAKPGINLPIRFNGRIIGVVGITSDPQEVEPYGEIVKNPSGADVGPTSSGGR